MPDPQPPRRRLARLSLRGALGLFAALAAWLAVSGNEGLPAPQVRAAASGIAIDWDQAAAEATNILQRLLQIPTVNPPGDEEPAARLLAALLAREGIAHEVITTAPNRALIIARLPGKTKEGALCLTSHLDVVPAEPAEWRDPNLPFSGKLADGRIYGRGALDMKGFVVMQLMSLILAKRAGLTLERDLVLLALPDEEAGAAAGAQWLIKQRPELLQGISCMWNEGGMGSAGILGIDRPVFALMSAERGNLWIELSARGPSGHGSSAPDGAAPARLLTAINRIFAEPEATVLSPIVRRQLAELASAAPPILAFILRRADHPLLQPLLEPRFRAHRFLRAITRNTRTLTVLSAGQKVNVVPSQARAQIDLRLLPGVAPEAVLAQLRARLADLDIEVSVLSAKEATESPVDHPLFDVIRTTCDRLNPGAIVIPLLSPGGTDSAYFRTLGIACYGLIPAIFTDEDMRGFHGKDESITVAQLRAGVEATFEAAIAYSRLAPNMKRGSP